MFMKMKQNQQIINLINNIYGTHHIGVSTKQASDAVGNEVIRIVKYFLCKGEIINCVNLEKSTPSINTYINNKTFACFFYFVQFCSLLHKNCKCKYVGLQKKNKTI